MKKVILNNGVEMPMLGFGVFQIMDQNQCEQCVLDALMSGYRLIDTAAAYLNEEAVGKAIKRSTVPRQELFITTKVWVQDAGYENTKQALETSLNKLGLEYLDLYLIHQPYGDIYGSWRAMEKMNREGKVRAIGVSNFTSERLIDLILHNEITPAVNQVEIHPFYQQAAARQILDEYKVQPEAWGPFAEGKNNMFRNEVLTEIGKKYDKSVAQVILRWNVQNGVVSIPKSVHKERIEENLNIWDFELSTDDMKNIAALDTNQTLFMGSDPVAMVKRLSGFKIH